MGAKTSVVNGTDAEGDYPERGWHFTPIAPTIWLAIVWMSMVLTLFAVGYLDADTDQSGRLKELIAQIGKGDVDYAARRAAQAFSGVALAITLTLAIAGLVWAVSASLGKQKPFKVGVLALVTLFLALSLSSSWWVAEAYEPFTSRIGQALLNPEGASGASRSAGVVPTAMFFLACMVPSVLLAGSTFLLQPMRLLTDVGHTKRQLKILAARVKELDQMLYIGALALVFGTIQLSSGLSVPLASMPKTANLKAQAELCKLLAPSAASASASNVRPSKTRNEVQLEQQCQALPAQLLELEWSESLRQLARSVTLSFGLAFSALLAAVYVPSLVGLRLMIERRLEKVPASAPDGEGGLGEFDPLHRVAAVVATLSPVFAGLVANSLAG